MRKLIMQQWMSLDGYAADASGSVSFIEPTTDSKYSDIKQLEWLDSIDTILLGANTYKLFVEFWPTATNDQEIIADKLNSIPKIIFSRTMKKTPWGNWPDAQVISTDVVKAVNELKSQQGKNIVLWGSITIAQLLMHGNIIDEYHIRIVPVTLGKGTPLFASTGSFDFKLYESDTEDEGFVLLKYRRH